MNTMKYFLLITILLSITAPVLKAQSDSKFNPESGQRVKIPKKTPEQKATALTDTLNAVVALSAEQYQKVRASNLKYVEQKEALKKSNPDNMQAVTDKMKEISKTRKKEIAAILTPEQTSKWKLWKQENKKLKSAPEPAFDDIGDM